MIEAIGLIGLNTILALQEQERRAKSEADALATQFDAINDEIERVLIAWPDPRRDETEKPPCP